jgi:hypothetical protein
MHPIKDLLDHFSKQEDGEVHEREFGYEPSYSESSEHIPEPPEPPRDDDDDDD